MEITWGNTLSVVVVGLVVVFVVLLILVAVCFLMGKLFQAGGKKKTPASKPSAPAPTPASAPVKAAPIKQAAPVVEGGITDDVVAAITAAVSCIMGPDVPFAVTGIKRAEKVRRGTRPAWSNAGILENTRPF